MADPAAPIPGDAETPPRLQFVLTVQPGTRHHAWRAWLSADGGAEQAFASPIELLRHLAQLGPAPPPPGTLK